MHIKHRPPAALHITGFCWLSRLSFLRNHQCLNDSIFQSCQCNFSVSFLVTLVCSYCKSVKKNSPSRLFFRFFHKTARLIYQPSTSKKRQSSLFNIDESFTLRRVRSSSVIPSIAVNGKTRWTLVFTLFTFWPPFPPLCAKRRLRNTVARRLAQNIPRMFCRLTAVAPYIWELFRMDSWSWVLFILLLYRNIRSFWLKLWFNTRTFIIVIYYFWGMLN